MWTVENSAHVPNGKKTIAPQTQLPPSQWDPTLPDNANTENKARKNELFMFKHGNRASTLSLLGWHPCVISQPVWLAAGPGLWISKTVLWPICHGEKED